MPVELQELKEKLKKEMMSDKEMASKMAEEEMVNPWLITEVDFCGNPHTVDD